jgi:hypothetical protein
MRANTNRTCTGARSYSKYFMCKEFWTRYYHYAYSTDKETWHAEISRSLPKLTQWVNGRSVIKSQSMSSRVQLLSTVSMDRIKEDCVNCPWLRKIRLEGKHLGAHKLQSP